VWAREREKTRRHFTTKTAPRRKYFAKSRKVKSIRADAAAAATGRFG
jgi:hypothetical protein